MSESYTGADFQQQASSSKRRRRPIYIAPKNRAILQTDTGLGGYLFSFG
jgi:hypothetical protein